MYVWQLLLIHILTHNQAQMIHIARLEIEGVELPFLEYWAQWRIDTGEIDTLQRNPPWLKTYRTTAVAHPSMP